MLLRSPFRLHPLWLQIHRARGTSEAKRIVKFAMTERDASTLLGDDEENWGESALTILAAARLHELRIDTSPALQTCVSVLRERKEEKSLRFFTRAVQVLLQHNDFVAKRLGLQYWRRWRHIFAKAISHGGGGTDISTAAATDEATPLRAAVVINASPALSNVEETCSQEVERLCNDLALFIVRNNWTNFGAKHWATLISSVHHVCSVDISGVFDSFALQRIRNELQSCKNMGVILAALASVNVTDRELVNKVVNTLAEAELLQLPLNKAARTLQSLARHPFSSGPRGLLAESIRTLIFRDAAILRDHPVDLSILISSAARMSLSLSIDALLVTMEQFGAYMQNQQSLGTTAVAPLLGGVSKMICDCGIDTERGRRIRDAADQHLYAVFLAHSSVTFSAETATFIFAAAVDGYSEKAADIAAVVQSYLVLTSTPFQIVTSFSAASRLQHSVAKQIREKLQQRVFSIIPQLTPTELGTLLAANLQNDVDPVLARETLRVTMERSETYTLEELVSLAAILSTACVKGRENDEQYGATCERVVQAIMNKKGVSSRELLAVIPILRTRATGKLVEALLLSAVIAAGARGLQLLHVASKSRFLDRFLVLRTLCEVIHVGVKSTSFSLGDCVVAALTMSALVQQDAPTLNAEVDECSYAFDQEEECEMQQRPGEESQAAVEGFDRPKFVSESVRQLSDHVVLLLEDTTLSVREIVALLTCLRRTRTTHRELLYCLVSKLKHECRSTVPLHPLDGCRVIDSLHHLGVWNRRIVEVLYAKTIDNLSTATLREKLHILCLAIRTGELEVENSNDMRARVVRAIIECLQSDSGTLQPSEWAQVAQALGPVRAPSLYSLIRRALTEAVSHQSDIHYRGLLGCLEACLASFLLPKEREHYIYALVKIFFARGHVLSGSYVDRVLEVLLSVQSLLSKDLMQHVITACQRAELPRTADGFARRFYFLAVLTARHFLTDDGIEALAALVRRRHPSVFAEGPAIQLQCHYWSSSAALLVVEGCCRCERVDEETHPLLSELALRCLDLAALDMSRLNADNLVRMIVASRQLAQKELWRKLLPLIERRSGTMTVRGIGVAMTVSSHARFSGDVALWRTVDEVLHDRAIAMVWPQQPLVTSDLLWALRRAEVTSWCGAATRFITTALKFCTVIREELLAIINRFRAHLPELLIRELERVGML